MKQKKATFAVLLALLMMLCSGLVPMRALAEDSGDGSDAAYYLSYKKYAAATNSDGSRQITYTEVSDQISNLLEEGYRRYTSGVEKDGDDGYYKPFTNSYGFWYETSGFEKTVMGYISGARVTEVELHFSNMKKAVNDNADAATVRKEIDELVACLYEDAEYLDDLFGYSSSGDSESGSGLAWATFGAILSIIIREGLEAILIIGTLAAYTVKVGNKKGTRWIYIGTALAVVASFITAVIFYWVTKAVGSSLSQEFVEGITALIAVVVLVYVTNWMISKSESESWTNFLKEKANESSSRGKMLALGGTAFLAVYREGAEIVLFCQQYFNRAGSMKHGYLAIAAGILVGLLIVAAVFAAIRIFGIRLPLGKFFLATSVIMAVMSISFIGAGMWELFLDGGLASQLGGFVQDLAGTIPALSWMSGSDVLDFFGIHPTWITLIPQLLLTAFTVYSYVHVSRKKKKETVKA